MNRGYILQIGKALRFQGLLAYSQILGNFHSPSNYFSSAVRELLHTSAEADRPSLKFT